MIQVIDRAFRILKIISDNEKISLKDLSQKLDINKTTIGNILITFKNLGYLRKNERNEYYLSDTFHELSYKKIKKDSFRNIVESNVSSLADEVREGVALTIMKNNERYTIAETIYSRTIMVNRNFQQLKNLYITATGRIHLAYLNEMDLKDFVEEVGLPTKEEWPEKNSYTQLWSKLEEIRKEGISEIVRDDVGAIGIPVFNKEGKAWAGLGVYYPIIRLTEDKRKKIIRNLKTTSKSITDDLDKITTTTKSDTTTTIINI